MRWNAELHRVLSPPAVAGHAGLVSRRQRRQMLAGFVATAALARGGPDRVE